MEIPDDLVRAVFQEALTSSDDDRVKSCTSRLFGELWERFPFRTEIMTPLPLPPKQPVPAVSPDPAVIPYVVFDRILGLQGASAVTTSSTTCPNCGSGITIRLTAST